MQPLCCAEVNTSLFPILTVVLSGPIPERSLVNIAGDLKDDLEALSGVLEIDIGGEREELMEVLIDPTVFETYNLSFDELVSQISRNNRLIAAGALDTGAGRIVLKVPGLIEDAQDVLDLPIKVDGSTVLTFKDEAEAIKIANDTIYGLAAGVWTGDLNRTFRVSDALHAGVVWVNCFDHGHISSPFGGFKQSGFGRDKSLHAIDKYTDIKTTWINLG